MAFRGVHFALTGAEYDKLLSLDDDDSKIDLVKEEIGRRWDAENLQETDKAWWPIHCCLAGVADDQEDIDGKDGEYPLRLCILGGRQLLADNSEYSIRLIEPDEVVQVARALEAIDEGAFAKRFHEHCQDEWERYGEEGLGYATEYFLLIRDFFSRISGTGRPIIFTVDQ